MWRPPHRTMGDAGRHRAACQRGRGRRHWQGTAAATAALAAGGRPAAAACAVRRGGRRRCARAQRGTQRRMLLQPPLHGHAAGSGAGDSGNGSGAAAASPRCRRSAPRQTYPRSPSAAPRTPATRKDKQAASAGSGVCRGMTVAAHPLTRACEPPWCVCRAGMRACAGKRRETRRVARVRCRKACGKGVRTRAHAWAMRCTPGQQSRTRVPAKQRFVDRFRNDSFFGQGHRRGLSPGHKCGGGGPHNPRKKRALFGRWD